MKRLYFIAIAFALTSCAGSSAPGTEGVTQQKNAAEAAFAAAIDPYVPYTPPRENWSPGELVRASLEGDQITIKGTVCENLYAENIQAKKPENPEADSIERADVAIGNIDVTADRDFQASVSFLEKLIGKDNSLNIEAFNFSRQDVVKATINDTVELYVPDTIKWLDNGDEKQLSPKCKSAIDDYDLKGELDEVFIVTRVLSAGSITYEYAIGGIDDNAAATTQIGLKLNVSKIASANIGYDRELDSEYNLSTDQSLNIGFGEIRRIKAWLPSDKVSGDFGVVEASSPLKVKSVSIQ